MTTPILDAKPKLSKALRIRTNRRRWAGYLDSLKRCSNERDAAVSMTILMSTINAQRRWVRMKEENFRSLCPKWDFGVTKDYNVIFNGREFTLHVYFDLKSEKHYFSRLMERVNDNDVLPDWHVTTCNFLKRRNVEVTPELSGQVYRIGSKIIDSIRNSEGIWR